MKSNDYNIPKTCISKKKNLVKKKGMMLDTELQDSINSCVFVSYKVRTFLFQFSSIFQNGED